MKASKQSIGRALDQPSPDVRFYLFCGPDGAQSRALGDRLLQGLGAERFVVAAGAVRADPAALADEASAMSLFGGRRAVWIEPAGEEIAEGVAALLAGPEPESPVIAIAGDLKTSSGLRKAAESSPAALAFVAYLPEGADAARMVADVGRRYGLKVGQAVAARIADACGNDQAIVGQELQKLALYVDAAPQSPKELGSDALDAVGAEAGEGELPRLVDLALSGSLAELSEELARLSKGAQGIPVVRALQRRLLMLAPARARIERGETLDAVMTSIGRALFWKEKPAVAKMLATWDSRGLATVAERAGSLERTLMFSKVPAQEALGEELLAIARAARRR